MSIAIENQIVMKSLSEIKPYENNPRKNDKTVELLCIVIPKVGFNVPIVIDPEGVIVKGHARYRAAMRLKMKEVPCIITHADADAVRADRIADNKISEFSEWVNEELMHEIDMLDLDFDLSGMGFPQMSYEDIPDFEDFSAEQEEEQEVSDEDRRKLYEEFLEKQAKERAAEVQIASESEIKAAYQKQGSVPKEPRDYAKCVCKRCGNIMYIDRNVLYSRNGTIRRR